MPTTFIKNGQLVTEKGTDRTDILIEDGIVTHTASRLPNNVDETIDATNLIILPGLIDCHVHFREPGMVEAEDMESGSAAALAGGLTTACDMPNTEPPTCTIAALRDKLRRTRMVGNPKSQPAPRRPSEGGSPRKSQIPNPTIDIRLFFGVAKREHLKELAAVDRDDICGVKLYFGQSTGNLKVEEGIAEEIFRVCAERDIPLVCHCEDEETIQKNIEHVRRGGTVCRPEEGMSSTQVSATNGHPGRPRGAPPSDIRLHSDIRSVEAAVKATARAIGLAKTYGTQLHVAHVSTADELTLIQQAKADNLRVTCEVAPHHLFLNVDDYDALGALAKINPPLRTNDHCEALWRGILDGTVDCVASDHAPHMLESKRVEHALEASSGVPGVETMVPLLLSCAFGEGPRDARGAWRGATGGTQGVRRGAPLGRPGRAKQEGTSVEGVPSTGRPSPSTSLRTGGAPLRPTDILRLCFTNPNRIFRLGKSGIAVGKPADLILIDPNASWIIRGKELHSRCGWTPYEGWEVKGGVVRVIRR